MCYQKAIPGGLTDMLVVGALLICGDILALQKRTFQRLQHCC